VNNILNIVCINFIDGVCRGIPIFGPVNMPVTASCKAIILDLGGVLYDISYSRTSQAFQALGWHDFDAWYSQAAQTGWFDDLETGKISPEAFIQRVQQKLGTQVPVTDILNAWNAILLNLPLHRIEWLEALASQKPLFLLSNTNEIHLTQILRDNLDGRWQRMLDCFQKAYFSCRVGLRKPDPDIFRLVLDEQGLSPRECLFVDDSAQHIHSAQSIGIQTLWLQHPADITQELLL